jgi:hypothetical protein
MEGFLEQMRQNRHNGRPLITTLLRFGQQPAVTYQEAMKAVEQYIPDELKRTGPYSPQWSRPAAPNMQGVLGESDEATPAFASLSGGRSARQDYKGKSPLKYPARTVAMDADAPDLNYSRTDSIDGRDPIQQGGVNDLPEPEPVYASPAHRERATYLKQLDEYGRRMAATKDPRELMALGMATSTANTLAARADQEIQRVAQQGKDGLAGALSQLDPVLTRALERGDWQTYDSSAQTVLGQHLKDKDGLPFAAQEYAKIGRENAGSAIYLNARKVLEQHNGLAGAPPETALAVQRSMAYLHPFQPKNPRDVYERRQYINTLGMRLNTALNQANDPEMRDYLNALAAASAYYQSPWE